jgi:hypothetical protein
MSQQFYEKILTHLKTVDPETLKMSMDNVHAKGMFSLVIHGKEHGSLTRVFIATKKIKPFDVQLHSHRYPIKLAVISGKVRSHEAQESSLGKIMSKYKYSSPLNGGCGLECRSDDVFHLTDNILPQGALVRMNTKEIHTISCSKGSIWAVEEGGFMVDHSIVLGVPFTTDGLYTEPQQFQINDMHQLVLAKVALIVNQYQLNALTSS